MNHGWSVAALLAAGMLAAGVLAACDDGGSGGSGLAGSFAADAGSDIACDADDQCGPGSVCFAGRCVFQGEAPDRRDAGVSEEERSIAAFSLPAAGREHVWIASPENDFVVRIHAETLEISTVEVGRRPTDVRVAAGGDTVVVLNRGSDELSLIRAPSEVEFVDLGAHFNALTLSPDGRYALAWFDLGRAEAGEDPSALQDVAVVELESGRLHAVTVGFRPREVVFDAEGEVALVITEDGVSGFLPAELGPSTLAATVPVAPDVFGQAGREVVLSPDGLFACSRGPGEDGITVVDLGEGVPRFVPLPGEPSDLDLLPDGRTALVMLRDAGQLALVPIETAVEDPATIELIPLEGQVLGQAAIAGEFALLFTTLPEQRPQISVLHLPGRRIVHRPLRKGIAAVDVSPGGQQAVVTHTKADGDPDPALGEEAFLARSYGYTVVDVRTTLTRLQTTPADPRGLVFGEGEAFVLLRGQGVAALQRIDLAGFSVQTHELGTPPEVVGVLPAVHRAFVTQTHPEGRISFLDLGDDAGNGGRLQTVSGYTLNGRID
ncbi:MAG: hypothetical protein R3F43_12370 [bacterium]